MNKDEMNRAIAEACGWKRDKTTREEFDRSRIRDIWVSPQGRRFIHGIDGPPDYASCLNACAEFEHYLEFSPNVTSWFGEEYHSSAIEAYMGHLFDIAKKDDWVFVTAKPEIRAEAFLRTLSLYQDTRES